MAAHQAPLSLGFSRQEHWSGLPFPSPKHESGKWKSNTQVSESLLQALLNWEITHPNCSVNRDLQRMTRQRGNVHEPNNPGGVPSVSYDHHDKVPQHPWLKAIAIYSLTVPQIRKQAETSWSCMKIKVLAEPQSLREALEEKQSLASSIERCWYSLCSLACGPTTDSVVASGVTLPSLLVPEISSSHLPLQGHLWLCVLPTPRIQDDLPISRYFFFNISFWLLWTFIAACRLSLVMVNRGYSSSKCAGFSLRWLL